MIINKVKEYLKKFELENRVIELHESSATVEMAALALHTREENIAKTLSFLVEGRPILIVCAGTTHIDNHKFKEYFHSKANMIKREEVNEYIGHEPGGVCPFAIHEDVQVYLDESLKKLDILYPAAGNPASAVKLTVDELVQSTQNCMGWINVGK